jgi:hypothetical protein
MGIKEWLNRLWGRIPADPVDRVEVTRKGLVIHSGRRRHTVAWEDVKSIAIHFVTGSPESRDTHCVPTLDERELRIPLDINAVEYSADTPVVTWENPSGS